MPVGKQNFTFISFTDPDDVRGSGLQKQIRRHIMRDVGRSRRRKPRYERVELEVAFLESLSDDLAKNEVLSESAIPISTSSTLGPARSLNSPGFPAANLSIREVHLVHFMKWQADHHCRPFMDFWFSMGMFDLSAFYLSLAYTAVDMHHMEANDHVANFENTREASDYYGRSLSHLSSRLCDERDRISDGVRATIAGLACYDARKCRWRSYNMHMDGLHRIHELRGGFYGPSSHVDLLAFWVEIAGAIVTDSVPRFPIPPDIRFRPTTDTSVSPLLQDLISKLQQDLDIFDPLILALQHLSSLAAIVNHGSSIHGFWKKDLDAIGWIGPAIHHLLTMPKFSEEQLESPRSNLLIDREVIRISCLIILSQLKERFALGNSGTCVLVARLHQVLTFKTGNHAYTAPELMVWALVVAALTSTGTNRAVFVDEIQQAMRVLGHLKDEDPIEIAKQVLWIHDLQSNQMESLAENTPKNRKSLVKTEFLGYLGY